MEQAFHLEIYACKKYYNDDLKKKNIWRYDKKSVRYGADVFILFLFYIIDKILFIYDVF